MEGIVDANLGMDNRVQLECPVCGYLIDWKPFNEDVAVCGEPWYDDENGCGTEFGADLCVEASVTELGEKS